MRWFHVCEATVPLQVQWPLVMTFGNTSQVLKNMGHLYSGYLTWLLEGSLEDKIRTKRCVQISKVAKERGGRERGRTVWSEPLSPASWPVEGAVRQCSHQGAPSAIRLALGGALA